LPCPTQRDAAIVRLQHRRPAEITEM
jgi:hypothetical protein